LQLPDSSTGMKSLLKSAANVAACLIVLPAVGVYRIASLAMGTQRVFPGWSQAFSLLPGGAGAYLRRAFYRFALPECGADSFVSFGTVISHATAKIGQRAYIGVSCMLGNVTLGEDVLIGSHVSIINGKEQHGIARLDVPVRDQPGRWPRISIGRDTWVGDRSVIMADVGKHCVIGAGSVVTKPIPDYAICCGVPARIIGYRGFQPAGDFARSETEPQLA
jgi:virginiamycin A acetyltransferase